MQLDTITYGLRVLLIELHYNSKMLLFYEREWKKIKCFLTNVNGNTDYDMERS